MYIPGSVIFLLASIFWDDAAKVYQNKKQNECMNNKLVLLHIKSTYICTYINIYILSFDLPLLIPTCAAGCTK